MMFDIENTKYEIKGLNKFKKQLKKCIKQGKDINKLIDVLKVLANGGTLDAKYQDHALINDKYYKDCRELHIQPDWLLVYHYDNEKIILILVAIGSHSEIFWNRF